MFVWLVRFSSVGWPGGRAGGKQRRTSLSKASGWGSQSGREHRNQTGLDRSLLTPTRLVNSSRLVPYRHRRLATGCWKALNRLVAVRCGAPRERRTAAVAASNKWRQTELAPSRRGHSLAASPGLLHQAPVDRPPPTRWLARDQRALICSLIEPTSGPNELARGSFSSIERKLHRLGAKELRPKPGASSSHLLLHLVACLRRRMAGWLR